MDGLTLGGSFGWTDYEFKKYILPPPDGDIAHEAHPAWTPKRSLRLSAQYDFPAFAWGGNAFMRLDGRYRSRSEVGVRFTHDPDIDRVTYSKAHWIVDARAGVAEIPLGKTALSISAWAKNLLNEDDVIVFGATVINQMVSYAPERTYGIDLTIRM
jgi:iron complex outermembrane receptor protein